MKFKIVFAVLLLGIVFLIGAAVLMTQRLLSLTVDPPTPQVAATRTRILPDAPPPEPTLAVQPTAPAPLNPLPPNNSQPPQQPQPVTQVAATPTPSHTPAAAPAATPATAPAAVPAATPATAPATEPAAQVAAAGTPPAVPVAHAPAKVPARQPPASSVLGKVTFLRGEATVILPDGKRCPLEMGADVRLGDRVDTGPSARIQITLTDGSVVSQGERSSIRFDEYVLDSQTPTLSKSLIAMISGACRIVTGTIAELNPGLFRVNSRLATMGIRGCDLGFRSGPSADFFYVLDIPPGKRVFVDSTIDGTPMFDMVANKPLPVPADARRRVDVVESRTLLQVTQGEGIQQRPLDIEEMRKFTDESTHWIRSRVGITPNLNGASITLHGSAPISTGSKSK